MINIFNVKKATKSEAFEIAFDMLQELKETGSLTKEHLDDLVSLVAYFRPDPSKQLKGIVYLSHAILHRDQLSTYSSFSKYGFVENGIWYATNIHYAVAYKVVDFLDGVYNKNLEPVDVSSFINVDDALSKIKKVIEFNKGNVIEPIPFVGSEIRKGTYKSAKKEIKIDINGKPAWINEKYYKTIIDSFKNPMLVSYNDFEGKPNVLHIEDADGNKAVIATIIEG